MIERDRTDRTATEDEALRRTTAGPVPEALDDRVGSLGPAAGAADLTRLVGNSAVAGLVRRAHGGDRSAGALAATGAAEGLSNIAVQRTVANGEAPTLQRDGLQLEMPGLTSPYAPREPTNPYQLTLDPAIEAQLRALDAMGRLLRPEQVVTGLSQVRLPSIPPGLGSRGAGAAPGSSPSSGPSPVPGPSSAGPPAPLPPSLVPDLRPGELTDIWNAVQADPLLAAAVQNLQDQALQRARSEWESLSTGGQVALVTTTVAIGAGAAAGVLSDPETREWVASALRGVVYPVPAVPGLGVQLDLGGDGFVVGLHLDIGRLLPSALGFGPGDATELGGPPNPYQGVNLQRAARPGGGTSVTDDEEDFADRLESAGSGAPLPSDVRGYLEERLDTGLPDVRVHTDDTADRLATAVNATAFTTGRDIYFSSGAYQPGTTEGQKLLVHEAVHTVQQAAGPVAGTDAGSVSVSDPSDRFEREASRIAASASSGGIAASASAGGAVASAAGGSADRAPAQRDAVDRAPVQRHASDQVSVQRDPAGAAPGGSVRDQVGSALGAPVTKEMLTARATIAAGQTIADDGENWVHTVRETHVHVYVTGQRLSVSFFPALVITADSGHWWWPNPDLLLSEAWFDFATGTVGKKASIPWDAAKYGGDAKLQAGIGDLFAKMPARMRSGGYDPFTDPQLPADLQTMASGMSGGGGGGGPKVKADGAEFTAEVTLAEELRRDLGGASLSLPDGTRITVAVRPQGELPTSAAEFANLQLASVELRFSSDARLNLKVLGEDLPVVFVSQAMLLPGGHLTLSYVLGHEALSAAIQAMKVAGLVQGIPEDPRDTQARALIEKKIIEHVDPMIRDAIRANRSVIPGLDLLQALGVK